MRRFLSLIVTAVLLAGCHEASSATSRSPGSHTPASDLASATSSVTAPTSAPAPTSVTIPTPTPSATPSKSADETIIGTPASVTLEALLPASAGKQRWTDQTFVVTGARAQRLVDELKAARVYAGDAPAGCQPTGHSTTIKVDSAGRQLSFRSYCDFIWAGDNAEMLWSPALVKAVDSTATSLRPTTVVVPPPTGTLQVGPITVYDKGSHLDRGVTGVVTVTQDGKRLASKRLGTGGRLSVKVVPGAYSVTGTSAGLRCQTMEVTVVPGEEVGGGPYCSKS